MMWLVLFIVNPLLLVNSALNYQKYFPYQELSETGGSYEFWQEIVSGCIFSVILMWMYANYQINIATVQKILEIDQQNRFYGSEQEPNCSKRYFTVNSVNAIITIFNSITMVSTFPFNLPLTLQMVQYITSFMYSAAILSFYASLVSKIQLILRRVNSRLSTVCLEIQNGNHGIPELSEIMKLLTVRNELLYICFKNLSTEFGLVVCLLSVYVLIDLTQVAFMIVITLEEFKDLTLKDIWNILHTSVIWVIPGIVNYMLTLACNGINNEVSF